MWSARAGAGATRILGAGRMMSLWPVRTSVLVDGGVAYCGSGIFPARETAVGLAPQGYLLATAEQLYVPCGRTAPLAYARADGALRGSMVKAYAVVSGKGVVSGDYGVLVDELFFSARRTNCTATSPMASMWRHGRRPRSWWRRVTGITV